MAKKLQLQVPTPCHENWDNMTPTEKGRFCASCQKQVIDFSNKSDREIAMFFKKPSSGSVCGRFMDDQLHRNIEIPKKRIPWLKYFFQFLIPALFISYRATAQGKVKVISSVTTQPSKLSKAKQSKKLISEVCTRRISATNDRPYNKTAIIAKVSEPTFNRASCPEIMGDVATFIDLAVITGKVIDEEGKPVLGVTISLKGTKETVVSDISGTFSITPDFNWKKVTLVTSSVGFVSQENQIARSNYRDTDTIILSMKPQLTGEVVVVGSPVRKTKTQKPIPLLRSILKDSSFSKFRSYPNPVRPNSTLTIEWKQKDHGDHLLQLFNQSGQLILSKDIYIDEKARLFTMNIPTIISGNYFLKLTSKTTGRSYTEKLIVE